jgi:Amt family ammonium transporter
VATNTALAAAFGAIAAMLYITRRTGKPDPGMMANGMLAGLVAITAPCAFVTPSMAAVIGAIAGVIVVESLWFVERKLKVDDPVGAISVHGVCGVFGVISVGLFANGSYGAAWNGSDVDGVEGLLFGGGFGQLGAQLVGVAVICTVIFGVAYTFFSVQDKVSKARGNGGIRSAAADEIAGLDLGEMGVYAYPEFEATIDEYEHEHATNGEVGAPVSVG